jgi:membrane-associated phospholipid phosphatase
MRMPSVAIRRSPFLLLCYAHRDAFWTRSPNLEERTPRAREPTRVNPVRLGAAIVLFFVVAAATFLLPSHQWDVAATAWLQRHASTVADEAASIFVTLGDAEVLIPAVAFVAFVLWRRGDGARAAGVLWLAAGLAAVSFIAFALKYMVPHPGPPPEFQRAVVRYGIGVPEPYSFPSGHTMRTTFLVGTTLRQVPAAAGILVAAMMMALVYLGDHWTSDVLGGLCLGWMCAEIARGISKQSYRLIMGRASRLVWYTWRAK